MFDNFHREWHGLSSDSLVMDYMCTLEEYCCGESHYEYWFFFQEDGTVVSGTYFIQGQQCYWLSLS